MNKLLANRQAMYERAVGECLLPVHVVVCKSSLHNQEMFLKNEETVV